MLHTIDTINQYKIDVMNFPAILLPIMLLHIKLTIFHILKDKSHYLAAQYLMFS